MSNLDIKQDFVFKGLVYKQELREEFLRNSQETRGLKVLKHHGTRTMIDQGATYTLLTISLILT